MEDLDRALSLVPESALQAGADAAAARRLALRLPRAAARTSRSWAEEALRLAREAGDRDAEAQALALMAVIEAGPLGLAEPGSEAFRLIAQAREIAQQAGAYQPVIKLVIYESHLLCGVGEYERAAAVAREGIADAERHGLARTRGAFLAINVAEPLLYLGRWDEAPGRRRAGPGPCPALAHPVQPVDPDRFDRARPRRHRHRRQARGRQPGGARRRQVRRPAHTCRRRSSTSGWRWPPRARPPPSTRPTETLQRSTTCPAAAPRYVWPLLVTAAAAARQAARRRRRRAAVQAAHPGGEAGRIRPGAARLAAVVRGARSACRR